MRCACGEHDLPPGELEPCYFCEHPTLSRTSIDWSTRRLHFAICHKCAIDGPHETLMPLHLAPDALVRKAKYSFGTGGGVHERLEA